MSEDTRGVLGHIGGALHSAKDVADIAKEGIVTGSLLFNGVAAPPPCTPLDTHFDPPAISQELDPAECPQLQDSFMDSLDDLVGAKESELQATADKISDDLGMATVAKNEPVAALDLGPDDIAEMGVAAGMEMGGAADGGMDIGGTPDMGGMDIVGGAEMGGMDIGGGPGGMA
jgi:hypothetical protein